MTAGRPVAAARALPEPPPPGDLIDQAAQRAVATLTPAYVVINEARDVVRFAGPIGRYLGPSPGAASWNVFDLLQRNLRPAARAALQKRRQTRARPCCSPTSPWTSRTRRGC